MCKFHYNAIVEEKKQLEALHSYVHVTTNSCENGATQRTFRMMQSWSRRAEKLIQKTWIVVLIQTFSIQFSCTGLYHSK